MVVEVDELVRQRLPGVLSRVHGVLAQNNLVSRRIQEAVDARRTRLTHKVLFEVDFAVCVCGL